MITTIRLRNFKAFQDTDDIQLKPITVLAGTNSGGKSSLLQSLLLLKQTLDSPQDVNVNLDGKHLQYSSISDLTFGKPHESKCNIIYNFGLRSRIPRRAAEKYFDNSHFPKVTDGALYLDTSIELSFRQRQRQGISANRLDSFAIRNLLGDQLGPSLEASLRRNSTKYNVTMQGKGTELTGHYEGREIDTVETSHFLPRYFLFKHNQHSRRHFMFLDYIFWKSINDLEEELTAHINYLGPLRDRPNRAYLHSGNPMPEIGESGEYAAQILWLERDNMVSYVPTIGATSKEVPLIRAVNESFAMLGLSQPVDVDSKEGIVYQILLPIGDRRSRRSVTIADVGFGVSQLLPILVLGLRSSKGSLQLLEQPEIHLHPKLQANLADFFITLAQSGRRMIVETHSDHFINRLRRRIAEDPSDTIKDLVNILFVHPPSGRQGASIEQLSVDRFGVIENWPEDFLPESADEAEAILVAGLKKRTSS